MQNFLKQEVNMLSYNCCELCPRNCRVDRTKELGFCRCSDKVKIARAALHFWEEPCISGKSGSGAVFFSGCTLKCCYCQNLKISRGCFGKEVSGKRLAEIFLELQDKGANNINLVTPTQYLPTILPALDSVKGKLKIPIVYNCGGFEKAETIKMLNGYVDIYLPDIKYFSSENSFKYSSAKNYFETAVKAVNEMITQTGKPQFKENSLMKKGVIIRHLVIPGLRKDSIDILNYLAKNFEKGSFLISIMSQYTPPEENQKFSNLNRRITSFEYNSVIEEALKLGLSSGFMQEKSSAKEEYTPPFDLEGV